uniref:HAT C-terminal dimerisation domain-containing protein n=1 Tax=Amphiprion ocellaris TaxID=80972 RepID=A0A3Q1CEU5_AMPOC
MLSWLKGSKRTRSESEADSQTDTIPSQSNLAGAGQSQTRGNAGSTIDTEDIVTSNEEEAINTPGPSEHESGVREDNWPEWQKASQEWCGFLVSPFGRDKSTQQASLRKKIKEHKDSIYHKKAVEIKNKATHNVMQKHIEDMQKADFTSTCNVFRTAYKIGKHDVSNFCIRTTRANILDHISVEMKKKVVNDIVMNQRKLCVLIDESTTISGKSVLVIYLRSAICSEEPDTIFFELIELESTTAKDITDALLDSLHKNGFDINYLQNHFLAFACDGASVMLGRKAGVATQLVSKFPSLFVWHCSNHRLELAVCDVLKEVGGINHFKIFLDQLYTLCHASPKNQRELTESAHSLGQRLLVIGRVLSVRWVASSERTVKAVWENFQALHIHFTKRAKYKGLNDILTSVSFVVNLGVMFDALTELSDLSRMLQRRDMTLDHADRLLARQIRVFESMIKTPGPHTQTATEANEEKVFKNVTLHDNQRVLKINPGQFFRSLAENIKSRMTPTTSSHVSRTSSETSDCLLTDLKVLQSDSWPPNVDILFGDAEVRRLCLRLRVKERESVNGFREYLDLKASKTPATLEPLLKAVHTIAVSTSECERAFSSMNDTLTDKRNSMDIRRLSNLMFLKCNGPPLHQFNAQTYVRSWLGKGRRSASCTACESPTMSQAEPKTCWSLF